MKKIAVPKIIDTDGHKIELPEELIEFLWERYGIRRSGWGLYLEDSGDNSPPVTMRSATSVALVSDAIKILVRNEYPGAYSRSYKTDHGEFIFWSIVIENDSSLPDGVNYFTELRAWFSTYNTILQHKKCTLCGQTTVK